MALYREKGVQPYWEKDDLAGNFDFTWRGTSLNSSKEYQLTVANDMMDRYLPQPIVAGNMLATWEILKRGLEARGVKDWDKILPPREAIKPPKPRARARFAYPLTAPPTAKAAPTPARATAVASRGTLRR